ncbi:MAG TPA: adenylosuccinate synthase [Acholeplasmataceae bacterium]|nr:adenylosuccinate synthase [Acholeplasmataceae bacterium]
MSRTVVVLGTQWGDEGKGKITHYLSNQADFVVRYQGGDNAGHTIRFQGKTHKLHLLPSGVFNPRAKNILGNGMVVNPKKFLEELDGLKREGQYHGNIFISDRAHVLFDHHRLLDGLSEEKLGAAKIGTTKRGIGPAYTDKAARTGIRFADFVGPHFPELFRKTIAEANRKLAIFHEEEIDPERALVEYGELAEQIRPFVIDSVSELNEALSQSKKILFEGAQGTLLDVDFGTYPFVTSSNCSAGGVATGSGIAPNKVDEVLGVVKAYSTRVGEGPFPTEIEGETADYIRKVGNEYGTSTGRPRRIGWFDAVLVNYSRMVNGLSGLAVTLLDVLGGLDTIKICTGYELNGRIIRTVPASVKDFENCRPVFEELPGWKEDISGCKSFSELPENAKRYLARIEEITGVPVVILSVGPDQKQTIVRREIF